VSIQPTTADVPNGRQASHEQSPDALGASKALRDKTLEGEKLAADDYS
jgi:hypothetical protein